MINGRLIQTANNTSIDQTEQQQGLNKLRLMFMAYIGDTILYLAYIPIALLNGVQVLSPFCIHL